MNLRQQRKTPVIKSNELIQRSKFSLSTQQQKMVLYLISKIKPTDKDFDIYEFNIQEFCKVCGIDYRSGKNYADLKEQIKSIADKSMWIYTASGVSSLVRWIEKPYIDENSGIVKIKLDNDLKPYLLELQNNYTKYDLIYTLCFKSKYSIRLYELLKSIFYGYDDKYTYRFAVDDLKEKLDYTGIEFFNFHNKVIKVAVAEINALSDLRVEYEIIKSNRKATHISFTIENKSHIERLKIQVAIEDILNPNPNQLQFDFGEDEE